jgi:guanine deaminase
VHHFSSDLLHDPNLTNPATAQRGCHAWRGKILYFTDDPAKNSDGIHWFEDGLLVIQDGYVLQAGDAQTLTHTLPEISRIHDTNGQLILPGFIDTHLHYPQTDIIASAASGLLPWLTEYTFPAEIQFNDEHHARLTARFFLDELIRCGTTTGGIFCTSKPESVNVFFAESQHRNLRMVAGKVLMDRYAPDALCDSAEQGALDSETLIQRWHNVKRNVYAISPRFAVSSSCEQLFLTQELANRYPDTVIQTHLAENKEEINLVKTLFPDARSYLDVYDHYELLRPGTVLGHCLWLDSLDQKRIAETGAHVSLCPTANLFLGSGLINLKEFDENHTLFSVGSDIGAGTSFSMLQTLAELYKIARIKGQHIDVMRLLWLATRAGAEALGQQASIGSFTPGLEADFILLNPKATPLLARRTAMAKDKEEWLFSMVMLGDDRTVSDVFIMGKSQF